MRMSFFVELAVLTVVTGAALVYSVSPLAKYDLQVVLLLLITVLLSRRLWAGTRAFYLIEVSAFIFVVLSVVLTTGGLSSPFFFLIYFMLFSMVFILDTTSSVIETLLIMVLFLTTSETSDMQAYIPVLCLPFIIPLVHYVGMTQRRLRIMEKKHMRQEEGKEQTLLFLTTNLYRHVQDLEERVNHFMGDADLQYVRQKIEQLKQLVHKFVHYVEKI